MESIALHVFTAVFYKAFKEKIKLIICNIFQKREAEEILMIYSQHYPISKT
jgi:hypothetical protein